jgi:hypothetical protein
MLEYNWEITSAEALVDVWDAHTGREVATLEGYGGIAHSCAWSPDGRDGQCRHVIGSYLTLETEVQMRVIYKSRNEGLKCG